MKKTYFLASLLAFSILAVFFVSASFSDWITGKAASSSTNLPATRSCTDSDNGINKSTAGTITYTFKKYGLTRTGTNSDVCDSTWLTEYYCEGKQAKEKKISCTGGCSNGRCLESSGDEPAGYSCTDSDNGANASQAGYISGSDSYGSFDLKDECISSAKISEKICTEDDEPKAVTMNCKGTAEGKCKNQTIEGNRIAGYCQAQELQCSDSDNGKNYSFSGKAVEILDESGRTREISDKCTDSTTLKEAYCNGVIAATETYVCPGSNSVCEQGKCVTKSLLCQDRDLGYDIDVREAVTIWHDDMQENITDYCINDNILIEFGCSIKKDGRWTFARESLETPRIAVRYVNCNGKCSIGRCITGKGEIIS